MTQAESQLPFVIMCQPDIYWFLTEGRLQIMFATLALQ